MIPRWLVRPIIPALLIWGFFLLVVFLIVDLSLMPWLAGRFAETKRVPSVIGLEVKAAEDTLKRHGLRFGIDTVSEHSNVIPKDRVLSQTPDSGSIVKDGRRVWVVLSRGRAPRSR
jgi:beta-lactam-binding protein with PASTA domain